ncbi:aldo/keto reductase [Calothrix sp. HK-06]|nr:aldo/keto reductase [Calothrix sp. HK-06]
MKTRKLGNLTVSSIGLGCMGMSGMYGSADEQEAIATIHKAIELTHGGATFLDTADAYGVGHNEELVGKAIRGKREQVIIATKFGLASTSKDGKAMPVNGKPEYVRQACEASLHRLGIDTIDLYYQHRVDPNVPIEDTVGAMAELVKEGKVKYIGLSEASAKTLYRASKVHSITAIQSEYSLWSRDVETEILPAYKKLGIGFVPWSPLGRGFLTGKIQKFEDLAPDDWRRNSPRFQGDNFQHNLNLVTEVQKIAVEKNCTSAQLALAWLLAQDESIVPIPGTKRISYLLENLGALEVQLSNEDLTRIDSIVPRGAFSGERYPAALMQMVNI